VARELTPRQREALLEELRALDEKLKELDAMLSLLCRLNGIDPDAVRAETRARAAADA
jgi:hypothetical protein